MADDRIRIIVEPDTSGFQRDLASDLSRVDASIPVEVTASTDDATVAIRRFSEKEGSSPIEKVVDVDDKGAQRRLADLMKRGQEPLRKLLTVETARGEKALKAFEAKAKAAFNRIAQVSKVALVGGATTAGALALNAAKQFGELEQNLGGSEAVFGRFAETVQNEGLNAYKNLGVAQADYLAAANKMGSLFQGSGIDQQKSLELTTKAMQRAADVASVMGVDMEMAMESVAGAAKGNFTMMDNLGVAMNDTALKAYALEKGVNFKWEAATQAQKNELAMRMFFERTEQYAGNFARESEETITGAFGMMRSAWGNFQTALANPDPDALGQASAALMNSVKVFGRQVQPLMLRIGTNMANGVLAGLSKLTGIDFGDDALERLAGAVRGVVRALSDSGAIDAVKDAVRGTASAIKSTLGFLYDWRDVLIPIAAGIAAIVAVQKAWTVALGVHAAAVKAVTLAQTALNAVMRANPLGLLLTVLVGVGTALYVAYQRSETFRIAVQALVGWVSGIGGWFAAAWDTATEAVSSGVRTMIAFVRRLPGMTMNAVRSILTRLRAFFASVWRVVTSVTVGAVTAYVNFYRQLPGRLLTAITPLGQLLWSFIQRVWSRFRSITTNAVSAYIGFIRNIPGRVVSAIGSVGKLLYGKGRDIIEGLWDGLKSAWNKVRDWLGGLGDKIKKLKGPIEVDRTLLVDEGKAIMSGFHKGLKSKWDGVEGWLSERGGFIKGMLSKVGLADITDKIGKLFTGEVSVGDVNAALDKHAMDGMHPSSGPADTWRMANIIAKRFGVMISSFLRPGARTTTGNLSQHAVGMAADFSNGSSPTPQMDALAEWARRLIGKAFYQVLYRTMVGGNHFNHVHIGWIPREHGGNVKRSGHYMVGEAGPEAFIPNSSGFILNNTRLDRMLNVDRRLGMLEHSNRRAVTPAGAQVHQEVTINMPEIRAADGQGWAMMSTNRLLEMLRANAVSMVGGVA